MKRVFCAMICCFLLPVLAGCRESGAAAQRTEARTPMVKDVTEAGIAEQESPGAPETAAETALGPALPAEHGAPPIGAEGADEGGIDVDLTKLSGTIVYSELYNMMVSPEAYIGKTVKLRGSFDFYRDPATGASYFMCLVRDATACCAQGMEFVLTEEYSYPEDYPEPGQEICVVGVFDTYLEGQNLYCTLRNARRVEEATTGDE